MTCFRFGLKHDVAAENIVDLDGIILRARGYSRSIFWTGMSWLGYIMSLGLLRLLFHWFPHWHLMATHSVVCMRIAQRILILDQYSRYFVENIQIVTKYGIKTNGHVFIGVHNETAAGDAENSCSNPNMSASGWRLISGNALGDSLQSSNEQLIRFFNFRNIKYIWDAQNHSFSPLRGWDSVFISQFFDCRPLNSEIVKCRQAEFGPNSIPIPLTPILSVLLKEGLNPFYIFQVLSCILWYLDDYYYYATCIIVISVLSLSYEIYELRQNEKTLQEKVVSSGIVWVIRKGFDEFFEMDSSLLVPGDIVRIPSNGCRMMCDAVLMTGNCIVNESMLTGESVPVTKTPLPSPSGQHFMVRQEANLKTGERFHSTNINNNESRINVRTHSRHILFCGTEVVQTRSLEDELVLAVVARTGFLTAKGELVRSILFPKPQEFKFNKDAMRYILVLFCLSLIGFSYTVYVMIIRDFPIYKIVLRSLDLITIVVPPALPVAMTVGVVFAQRRLKRQQIYCISPNTINVSGVVDVVCFDKTGTLTEEGLDMWGVIAASSNGQFKLPLRGDMSEQLDRDDPLLHCMATCHSLTFIDNRLSGDPLDLLMFQSLRWDFIEASSSSSGHEASKFGMAVPIVVQPKIVDSENSDFQIAILRQFTFSSSLQRMSVIIRVLNATSFSLFLKGSPEVVQHLCRPDTIPRDFSSTLMFYTREGYRVIGLAWRPLRVSFVKMQRIQRDEVERDLRFLGLVVMENRLKPETMDVVQTLKASNIRCVMVTGDNMLTALSVARDSDLIEETDRVIVVNANPPALNGAQLYQFMSSSEAASSDNLVEFHYAEDLQKPVTEITQATSRRMARKRGSHSYNLHMMDRPDYHLAMSGKTWAVIREHFPQLISKLVIKGTVFARFSPDQKTQLVEDLQRVGYYVSMCGDGANDCGALKAAHAGISLSETEASVASPFTSRRQNISCVPDLIREGRCALTTSFGTFKFMAGYSLTQFTSVLILYWVGTNLSDPQFLYIDLFVLTSLGLTFCYTHAYHRLSIKPPEIHLVSVATISSLIFHVLIHMAVQIFAFIYVMKQPWFVPFVYETGDDPEPSFEDTAVYLVCAFQYVTTAIVFSKGPPYRTTIFKNRFFLANICILTAINAGVAIYPMSWVISLFQLVELPSIHFRLILIGSVMTNFLLAYLVEVMVECLAFRNRLDKIKRILFPKMFSHKEYERIRDEIDRNKATWPVLIRSASIQDIRPEVFSDVSVSTIHEGLPRTQSLSCPGSEGMEKQYTFIPRPVTSRQPSHRGKASNHGPSLLASSNLCDDLSEMAVEEEEEEDSRNKGVGHPLLVASLPPSSEDEAGKQRPRRRHHSHNLSDCKPALHKRRRHRHSESLTQSSQSGSTEQLRKSRAVGEGKLATPIGRFSRLPQRGDEAVQTFSSSTKSLRQEVNEKV